MQNRPTLTKSISIQDFKDFYWLKEELVSFCKEVGLSRSGSKIEIGQRIIHYLKTGEQLKPQKQKCTSAFDWNKSPLSNKTIITDNYKNSENVRAFFTAAIGPHFSFNIQFMDWIKKNFGKNLGDAIKEWHNIKAAQKSRTKPKKIAPQFEYNTYIRDCLAANPNLTKANAVVLWNFKRKQRGSKKYVTTDLKWLD